MSLRDEFATRLRMIPSSRLHGWGKYADGCELAGESEERLDDFYSV